MNDRYSTFDVQRRINYLKVDNQYFSLMEVNEIWYASYERVDLVRYFFEPSIKVNFKFPVICWKVIWDVMLVLKDKIYVFDA